MGIMGVLNHSQDCWEGFVQGTCAAHDATVSYQLLHCLNPGDILCGDRALCTYPLISCLLDKGVFNLMRLHQTRHRALDWRKRKKLGKKQRLVTWKKPAKQPSCSPLSAAEWEVLPETLKSPPNPLLRLGSRWEEVPYGPHHHANGYGKIRLARTRRHLHQALGYRATVARHEDDTTNGPAAGQNP